MLQSKHRTLLMLHIGPIGSRCLPTKNLISNYLPTRRVVHGVLRVGQWVRPNRQLPPSQLDLNWGLLKQVKYIQLLRVWHEEVCIMLGIICRGYGRFTMETILATAFGRSVEVQKGESDVLVEAAREALGSTNEKSSSSHSTIMPLISMWTVMDLCDYHYCMTLIQLTTHRYEDSLSL